MIRGEIPRIQAKVAKSNQSLIGSFPRYMIVSLGIIALAATLPMGRDLKF